MTNPLQNGIAEATRLTREGRLAEATALIQRTLGGATSGNLSSARRSTPDATGRAEDAGSTARHTVDEPSSPADPQQSPRRPLRQPEPSDTFLRRAPKPPRRPSNRHRFTPHPHAGTVDMPGTEPAVEESFLKPGSPEGRFISRSYTGRAGSRSYKLYIPSGYVGQAVPLVVMLHGCTQNPDDFATGTRMNALAEEQTFFVVYPAQSQSANISGCWNWFKDTDQRRGQGEPSIIAGITREITEEYGVAESRVYVAGMSAGGAMAAILGSTYPDIYAAVGVHSGLAPGAAQDLPSAFSAMQRGTSSTPRQDTSANPSSRTVPVIVFHGDRDATIHPKNADHLLAHYGSVTAKGHASADKTDPPAKTRRTQVPGGYAYTHQVRHDTHGRTVMERWTVHGLGHTWSGGSSCGSYTDANGPDATAEMVRFFHQH